MVVNTVLISYLLQILLRSSLSPDTYGTRMVYLGDSFDSPSLLHVGLTADLIMCSGYPFVPRTSAKCFFSLSISSADAIVLARWNRQDATPNFTCAGWCEVYCRYLPVCVVFLYIPMLTLPSSLLISNMSKKGSFPSLSNSIVNWIVRRRLLRWSRNDYVCCLSITQKVSLTHLLHILGLATVLSAKSSNISI